MEDLATQQKAEQIATQFRANSSAISIAAGNATISNDDEYDGAARLLLEIKERFKVVDAKRKEFTQPLYAMQKKWNAFFKAPLDDYKAAELALKTAMAKYHMQKEQARAKALLEAQTSAQAQDKETFIQKMEVAADNIVPEAKGTHTREVVMFEVTDPHLVTREFCSPDERKIRAAVNNSGVNTSIPGVRVWKETKVMAHGLRGKK